MHFMRFIPTKNPMGILRKGRRVIGRSARYSLRDMQGQAKSKRVARHREPGQKLTRPQRLELVKMRQAIAEQKRALVEKILACNNELERQTLIDQWNSIIMP